MPRRPPSRPHARFPRGAAACLSIVLVAGTAWLSRMPAEDKSPEAEEEVHRAPGAAQAGQPAVADVETSGRLRLTIRDGAGGPPTPCRVNVVGPDGQYYEPRADPLRPWSLQRLGNRPWKGPFRYYGWFIYTTGVCELDVPPGDVRIEVWKGLEYRPAVAHSRVLRGQTESVEVALERAVDMPQLGWHSGDSHVHLDRITAADDARALDLAQCEDLHFMHVLCMNDPRTYRPVMDQQIWHQMQGLGPTSIRSRGTHHIASGQEYRCGTYGHICLVGGSRLVDADGLQTDPNQWPVFGQVANEQRALGGHSFHAHGGYEQEIYADFVQRATDGVELLQFAEYRGVSLAGWYHMLSAGYRFPALGASDFPYCRALGDCRTYVRIEPPATFAKWNAGAAAGRSFFTTGPLLELAVNDAGPGDTLQLREPATIDVTLRCAAPVGPPDELQLIVGGEIVQTTPFQRPAGEEWMTWRVALEVREPTWIAVRARGHSAGGREDVEAHTNPVYIHVAGAAPASRLSLEWLIAKLDQQIAVQSARDFARKDDVLAYYRKSRALLEARRAGTRE